MARLIVKAWVAVCLYAGALALCQALPGSASPWRDGAAICGAVLLFLIVGLMFALAAVMLSEDGTRRSAHFAKLHGVKLHGLSCWRCGFNEGTFAVFVLISFANQTVFAPRALSGVLTVAIEQAAYFAVPGQRAFVAMMRECAFDGGRIFASALSWCLALIYFGSAVSRLGTCAESLRRQRSRRPDRLGDLPAALLLGVCAVAGVQLLYVGSGYAYLSCSVIAGIAGGLIVGLVPLMLAYAIAEALILLIAGKG